VSQVQDEEDLLADSEDNSSAFIPVYPLKTLYNIFSRFDPKQETIPIEPSVVGAAIVIGIHIPFQWFLSQKSKKFYALEKTTAVYAD